MSFVDNVLGYGRWWNRLSNRILMSRENGLDANSLEFQSNAPLLRSSCFKNFRAGRQHQHPDTYQEPNTQKRQHRENGNTKKLQHQCNFYKILPVQFLFSCNSIMAL